MGQQQKKTSSSSNSLVLCICCGSTCFPAGEVAHLRLDKEPPMIWSTRTTHSYHSTTITYKAVGQRPSSGCSLTDVTRCLVDEPAAHQCKKRRTDLSPTRLHLTWPRELSSMDFPHTLLCCNTTADACTPNLFVDPTTPTT